MAAGGRARPPAATPAATRPFSALWRPGSASRAVSGACTAVEAGISRLPSPVARGASERRAARAGPAAVAWRRRQRRPPGRLDRPSRPRTATTQQPPVPVAERRERPRGRPRRPRSHEDRGLPSPIEAADPGRRTPRRRPRGRRRRPGGPSRRSSGRRSPAGTDRSCRRTRRPRRRSGGPPPTRTVERPGAAGQRRRQERADERRRVEPGGRQQVDDPARRRRLTVRPGYPDEGLAARRGRVGDQLLDAGRRDPGGARGERARGGRARPR